MKHLKQKDFDSIKKLLETLTIQQTSKVSGRSRGTIQLIKHSDTFKDYKAIRSNYDLRNNRIKKEKIMKNKKYEKEAIQEIKMYQSNGWDIKEETPEYFILTRNTATLGGHIVVFLLTFGWTLGLGNLIYWAVKKQTKKIVK